MGFEPMVLFTNTLVFKTNTFDHSVISISIKKIKIEGIEPPFSAPKAAVLPLNYTILALNR